MGVIAASVLCGVRRGVTASCCFNSASASCRVIRASASYGVVASSASCGVIVASALSCHAVIEAYVACGVLAVWGRRGVTSASASCGVITASCNVIAKQLISRLRRGVGVVAASLRHQRHYGIIAASALFGFITASKSCGRIDASTYSSYSELIALIQN